jgi:hypothetical protein
MICFQSPSKIGKAVRKEIFISIPHKQSLRGIQKQEPVIIKNASNSTLLFKIDFVQIDPDLKRDYCPNLPNLAK